MNTRDRIIRIAERLFFSRGFSSVSLHEICANVKIKSASLYYHFPGGKEDLYLEVVRVRTAEFRKALESIALSNKDLRSILLAFGHWYITQPPMNMILIAEVDMPFLTPRGRELLESYVAEALFEPLGQLFMNCAHEIRVDAKPQLLVSTFNVLLFSINASAKMGGDAPKVLVDFMVTIFMNGVARQTEC